MSTTTTTTHEQAMEALQELRSFAEWAAAAEINGYAEDDYYPIEVTVGGRSMDAEIAVSVSYGHDVSAVIDDDSPLYTYQLAEMIDTLQARLDACEQAAAAGNDPDSLRALAATIRDSDASHLGAIVAAVLHGYANANDPSRTVLEDGPATAPGENPFAAPADPPEIQ